MRLSLPALCTLAICGMLQAHTVPVLVVEAEFGHAREVALKVNLDPRLFLAQQPTSLPPVPASWWFGQDAAAQEKTRRQAADFVSRTLDFSLGATPLQGSWRVQPIDSASAFPLGEASTEVHLLAEHEGVLPASAGDFKMAIRKDCPVAVILLCSQAGDAERRPQSLFPGETSRGFPVSALPQATATTVPTSSPGNGTISLMERMWWLARSAHFFGDHILIAAVLGLAMHRRFWQAAGLVTAFHAADLLGALPVLMGWLPQAPPWMTVAFWIAQIMTLLQVSVLKSRFTPPLATFSAAGLLHGLNTMHLNLEADSLTPAALMSLQSGALLLAETGAVAACVMLARLILRRRTQQPCVTTA